MGSKTSIGAVTAATLASAMMFTGVAVKAGEQFFVEPDIEVLATYFAENPGDNFGFVAEVIGDLNGDDSLEYMIGAPTFPADNSTTGKIYVYSGADGGLITTFTGNPGDVFGFSVAGVGDTNDDGVSDYAAAGFLANGARGRLVVFSGADHSIIHDLSSVPGSQFGCDINAAGDVNVDGSADIIVGSCTGGTTFTAPGAATLISGATGETLWEAEGYGDNNGFGSGVSGLMGDVTGDAVPDQAVGAFTAGANATGLAYILSGVDGSLHRILEPLETAGSFGQFFAHAAGDVNADGVLDAYIGDFSDSALGPGSGRAYIFSGDSGETLRVFDAEFSGDGFGIGRGAGDVTGDGFDDLYLAGYTHTFLDAVQGGKATLFSGRNGGVVRTFTGTVAGAQLGFDAVPLGDVNGDELQDYLITGTEVAHVVAGVPANPKARVVSTCKLIASLPDQAFRPPARLRKALLCLNLVGVKALLQAERFTLAARRLDKHIRKRLDGSSGGNPGDDWITDERFALFVVPRVDGLILMAKSMAED